MKFADGYWLNQRGYTVHYASQAYEMETASRSIRVFATPTHIWNRGQTLGRPDLELTFTAVMEDVIKVSIVHYKGAADYGPAFELYEDPGYTPVICDTDAYVEMTAGKTRVRINRKNWSVQYYYENKLLTGSSSRALSYIEEDTSHATRRLDTQIDDGFWAFPETARLLISVNSSTSRWGNTSTVSVKSLRLFRKTGRVCRSGMQTAVPAANRVINPFPSTCLHGDTVYL